jgi:hypothetical protein
MSDPVRYRLLMLLLVIASLTGCSSGAGGTIRPVPAIDTTVLVRTELYFGLSKAHGGQVSEVEWAGFLDSVVTPRFPEGLTVLDAAGQYRMESGVIVRERSKLVILFHEDMPALNAAVEEIRAAYRRLFDQESVLRVDSFAGFSY